MPIVPGDEMFVQSVLPQGRLAYQDIHATPAEFGWQVAKTLQTIGKMSAKDAILEQRNLNKVNVDGTYANQFDPAARSIYEEYLTLKGKDAALGLPAYQQKMQDLAAGFRENLPNDMQRQEFDLMAGHRVQVNLDAMARHQLAQTGQWMSHTGDAMAQALSKRITDERYDFDGVAGPKGLIQNIRNVYASYGGATGIDEAASGLKATAAIDKSLSDAVLTEAQTNPTGAKLLYDRYAEYMSSEAVRQHVLDNLLPAARQEQNTAVYNDVLNRFNLAAPNADSSNINAAVDWIKDPENYKDQLSDSDQRNDMAKTIQGAWNRAREFHNVNQSSADGSFTDAVASGQIAGIKLHTWQDPKTGLAPSGDILQAAIDLCAIPIETIVSDKDTLESLSNDISNRHMPDQGAINQAYLRNLITGQDFRDLSSLYDSYQDPAKSRWFDYAKNAFNARFADSSDPNGVRPDAMKLLPFYLMGLDGAVRDQDLKGAQITDLTNKMLDDVGNLLPTGATGPPAVATQTFGGSGDAAPAALSDALEAGTTKNPLPADTNTGTNTNADTNVVDSTGKPDQIAGAQGSADGAQTDADRAVPQEENVWERAKEWGSDQIKGWAEEIERARGVWDDMNRPPVTKIHGKPAGAVSLYTEHGGEMFSAPLNADYSKVYEAGQANGADPIKGLEAIGHFGTFDFQRDKEHSGIFEEYQNASNYAAGVYMRGAGFSLLGTKIIAGLYALWNSSNAGDPKQSTWWVNGWKDADSGNLPIPPGDNISNVVASL